MNKKNLLIFGAGSIGNHMANASRKLKFNVDVTDISNKALDRMKNKIFPERYGMWDPKINLVNFKEIFEIKKKYHLVIIGTPPNTHFQIFKKVSKKIKYQNILIEKPIINYTSKNYKKFNDTKGRVFCGYNHSLSAAFETYFKILKKNKKKINKIHVEWKEGWAGILNAHPWLKNEFQSYLGNLKKGGGALQEHSHGLHLLLLIMNLFKIKLNKKNTNFFSINKNNQNKKYDCYTNLTSISKNTFIKYETDLISNKNRKRIEIETEDSILTIIFNYHPNVDAVIIKKNEKIIKKILFKKDRSTEFEREIKHITKINKKNYRKSPIYFKNAVNVIKIIREILRKN